MKATVQTRIMSSYNYCWAGLTRVKFKEEVSMRALPSASFHWNIHSNITTNPSSLHMKPENDDFKVRNLLFPRAFSNFQMFHLKHQGCNLFFGQLFYEFLPFPWKLGKTNSAFHLASAPAVTSVSGSALGE